MMQQGSNNTDMSTNHHTQSDSNCGGNATKLIVNYLPHSLSEAEMHQMFSSVGDLQSCVLMRDKASQQSMGYGFVDYLRPEDAAKAITSMNRLKIRNKILKVSYARPSDKAIKNANLYISGLPQEFTTADLEKLFSPYGKIIDCRILGEKRDFCSPPYPSKEVGFVRFDKKEEAEKAIEKLNGVILPGAVSVKKPLIVKFALTRQRTLSTMSPYSAAPFYKKPDGNGKPIPSLLGCYPVQSQHSGEACNTTCSYTNGMDQPQSALPLAAYNSMNFPGEPHYLQCNPTNQNPALANSVNEANYMQQCNNPNRALANSVNEANYMQQCSNPNPALANSVNEANYMQQCSNPNPALANLVPQPMVNSGGAQCVTVQAVNNPMLSLLARHSLGTYIALPGYDTMTSQGWNLFVGNFPSEMDENTLWQLFAAYGTVANVKIIRRSRSPPLRNFGFVTMTNYFQAVTAMHWLNGYTINNYSLHVAFQHKNSPFRN